MCTCICICVSAVARLAVYRGPDMYMYMYTYMYTYMYVYVCVYVWSGCVMMNWGWTPSVSRE